MGAWCVAQGRCRSHQVERKACSVCFGIVCHLVTERPIRRCLRPPDCAAGERAGGAVGADRAGGADWREPWRCAAATRAQGAGPGPGGGLLAAPPPQAARLQTGICRFSWLLGWATLVGPGPSWPDGGCSLPRLAACSAQPCWFCDNSIGPPRTACPDCLHSSPACADPTSPDVLQADRLVAAATRKAVRGACMLSRARHCPAGHTWKRSERRRGTANRPTFGLACSRNQSVPPDIPGPQVAVAHALNAAQAQSRLTAPASSSGGNPE